MWRTAVIEDGFKGTFWEDRYQCRNLVDEAAILICGMYIDLNQIRAGEASTPESSRHTSAYNRIQARQQQQWAALGLRLPCRRIKPPMAGCVN